MEKKILVPLDGTAVGEAVLPKLENLVLKDLPGSDVEITLLRVIPIVNYNFLTVDQRAQLPYTEADREELTRTASDYLAGVQDTLVKKRFRVKTMVRVGPAAEEIVKAASEIDASLIAMSTHGRSGIIRWAIGSVSDRVLRLEGKIPILAIRAGDESKETLPVNSLHSLMKPR